MPAYNNANSEPDKRCGLHHRPVTLRQLSTGAVVGDRVLAIDNHEATSFRACGRVTRMLAAHETPGGGKGRPLCFAALIMDTTGVLPVHSFNPVGASPDLPVVVGTFVAAAGRLSYAAGGRAGFCLVADHVTAVDGDVGLYHALEAILVSLRLRCGEDPGTRPKPPLGSLGQIPAPLLTQAPITQYMRPDSALREGVAVVPPASAAAPPPAQRQTTLEEAAAQRGAVEEALLDAVGHAGGAIARSAAIDTALHTLRGGPRRGTKKTTVGRAFDKLLEERSVVADEEGLFSLG